jgi:hypothetical protein
MKRNRKLILATAARVAVEQGHHYDQESWVRFADPDAAYSDEVPTLCGMAFCVAGNAVLENGWKLRFTRDRDYYRNQRWEVHWMLQDGTEASDYEIAFSAKQAMGLTNFEAAVLFDGDWLPARGLQPHEAIKMLAFGVDIKLVTNCRYYRHKLYNFHKMQRGRDNTTPVWGKYDTYGDFVRGEW